MGKVVIAGFTMALVVVLALVFFPSITSLSSEARSTDASDDLDCTTGVDETSCAIELTYAHLFPSTFQMTVTQTSPGTVNRISSTTVAADRVTLTVAGLNPSTSYDFTVLYVRENPDMNRGAHDLLRLFPLLFILGIVVVAVLAGVIQFGRG